MRLLLAETSREAKVLAEEGTAESAVWLALGPGAMWLLDQRSQDYRIPEDFYQDSELADFCLGMHRAVEQLCRHLDEKLRKSNAWVPDWFKPFTCHSVPLIILWDSLAGRVFSTAQGPGCFGCQRCHCL